jgi:hypothetical protein
MEKVERDYAHDVNDALTRIYSSDDHWEEFMAWLEDQRSLNSKLGGKDNLFIAGVVLQIWMLGKPI